MELDSLSSIAGIDYLGLLFAILVRWCVSLHSYSGENTPPMYGDYEAQRHWMEITVNLPVTDWYRQTADNNLTYWGLDYPPLTAYHSYLYGLAARVFVPQSVKLHTSHGHESYAHKLFMRYSVLLADLLIFVPAVYLYQRIDRLKGKSNGFSRRLFLLTILYPGLILIDHGHFQYNCVSLGLFVAAVALICAQYYRLSTVFFCLAVNYKQMELYHSLPFFFYILGKFHRIFKHRKVMTSFKFIVPIAINVIATFLCVWYPFLSSRNDSLAVLQRLFPIYRGIYEDKVASFWCILNVFIKVHNYLENIQMVRVCSVFTMLALLPSLVDLIQNPTTEKFKISLIISSMSFFLFSFHVHEKSILLAAISVALCYNHNPLIATWFLLISTFSMLPLLIKDGLFIPFSALSVLYYICCSLNLPPLNVRSTFKNESDFLNALYHLSLVGCVVLSVVSVYVQPPAKYPYLWPLMVSFYSYVHFVGFTAYYYIRQFKMPSVLVKRKEA